MTVKDMIRIRRDIISLGLFEMETHCLSDVKILKKCISIAIFYLENIIALGDDALTVLASSSIARLKRTRGPAFEDYLNHLISQIKKKW